MSRSRSDSLDAIFNLELSPRTSKDDATSPRASARSELDSPRYGVWEAVIMPDGYQTESIFAPPASSGFMMRAFDGAQNHLHGSANTTDSAEKHDASPDDLVFVKKELIKAPKAKRQGEDLDAAAALKAPGTELDLSPTKKAKKATSFLSEQLKPNNRSRTNLFKLPELLAGTEAKPSKNANRHVAQSPLLLSPR